MSLERRLTNQNSKVKSQPLPKDYLKMVIKTFTEHFEKKLTALDATLPGAHFSAYGELHGEEVVVAVTLAGQKLLNSTTFYASLELDVVKAQEKIPQALDQLVDSIGSLVDFVIENEKTLKVLGSPSLASSDEIPFEWTKDSESEVYLKMDKAHPGLEEQAEALLEKGDKKGRNGTLH